MHRKVSTFEEGAVVAALTILFRYTAVCFLRTSTEFISEDFKSKKYNQAIVFVPSNDS
jgi:hypothetical protein